MSYEGESKIVFIDGNLSSGNVRSIRGIITGETDTTLTVQRENGKLIIGKQFLVKIENWY